MRSGPGGILNPQHRHKQSDLQVQQGLLPQAWPQKVRWEPRVLHLKVVASGGSSSQASKTAGQQETDGGGRPGTGHQFHIRRNIPRLQSIALGAASPGKNYKLI